MNTNNFSNNNSDFDLLNIRNGWLDIKKESVQCNCIICQSTIAVNVDNQGNPSYKLPFFGDSSTEDNNCGMPYVDEQNIQRLRTFAIPPVDYGNTFKLHSNPNAKHTIYLDFNGHITEGTSWKNGARIESPAYDTDSNVNSLSNIEKEEIQKIWQRVAEDFAPFDVNITTEEPKDVEDLKKTGNGDERWGIRVVVTQDKDTQIAPGSGGVAYVGSFNSENDTPAFAFNKGENNAALTISHEVGHALGLSHDGILPSTSYHPGFGSGDTNWGPIMGAPFGKNITQWSKGDYYLADNTGSNANYGSGEDDLKIITTQNGFGYRVDDYGDNNSTAFKLIPTNTNTVRAFGIIERNTDNDVFSFLTGTGNVSFNINPSSRTYISDGNGNYTLQYLSSLGANLDIWAGLYKADGTLIAESNPVDSLFASFNLFLSAGEYYIHVDGIGKGTPFSTTPDGYTDYGSLGQYEIKGTIVAPPNDIVGIAPIAANKNEGDSGTTNFTFNLTRIGDTSAGTTVNWQVTTATNNSADASDFVGGVLPNGTITFAAGETSRQITVEISGDENVELDENFVVKLSNLSRGTLAPDAAIGTILSDDAEIRGVKWYDSNQNGVKDSNEPGLANWTIFIDQNQNGLLDSGEISTTTATDGSYTFSNLTPGTYSISEALQPGWQPTFPTQLQGQETYKTDDGTNDGSVYWTTGDTATFNTFNVKSGLEAINYISVNRTDKLKSVFLYQDKDGDARPDSNEKLIEIATNFTETSGFGTVAIPRTIVSGTFFVGALYQGNGTSGTLIALDRSDVSGNTWVSLANASQFNPSSFSAFRVTDADFLLRAHFGAIPQQVSVKGGDVITNINFGNYIENTPPVGNNDAVITNEDTSTSGNILSNDTDVQNDTLTVIEVNGNTANVGSQITLTSGALLTLNADGKFSYNPNGKFESIAAGTTATDSFTYKVSDGKGGTNTATATITINGVNDKPVLGNAIANQAATENVGFSFTIPVNTFSDIDNGDNLTYTVTKADGSALPTWLTFNPTTREFSGNPGNSDVGVIEIKVTVTDSGNESVSDIFALSVGNVNNPPQLNTNTLTISEGGTVTLSSGNLNATDIDNNNASLTFTISNIIGGEFQVDGVVKSSFTQQQITNGKVKFIHNGGETAPSYDVTVSDGSLTDNGKVIVNFTNVNDAPTDITLTNTSVAENNTAAVIGNLTVTDVDSSNFTYTVNDNRFQVVNNQLKLKSGVSLDFETASSISLEITATDNGTPSQRFTKDFAIAVIDVSDTVPKLNKGTNDIFIISGGNEKPKLSVTLLGHNSNLVNELGVFVVDDEQGTINGIALGKEGYAQAALERSKILFSAISNPPNGFNQNDLNSLVEFNSGNKLGFFLVRNSTIDAVRSGITPISEVLFSQPSSQKVELLEDGKYLISWEDGIGHSTIDFKDLVVQVQASSQPVPIGAKLQGNSQRELIDLRHITGRVSAEFVVNREAAFDNFIGFYQIADVNGGIDFDGNGTIDIRPGDTGYTQAALRGRIAGLDMNVMNQGTATFTTNLDGGSIYAPFIVANGKPEALLDNNPKNDPAVYFAFLGANPDKFDHIRLLGNNTWGFEDLPLGGDMDYNDVVIRASLRSV
jgi:VCBS repeat-containing protein